MAPLKYKTPDAGENSDEQETFLFFFIPLGLRQGSGHALRVPDAASWHEAEATIG